MSGLAHDLAGALREAERVLAAAGITSARVDAELLAAHALGVGRGELARLAVLGTVQPPSFAGLVVQRARRVPLQHLTGTATFRELELSVGPGVFVPRPETEVAAGLAVEAARAVAAQGGVPVVVDLCTGSGAIALSVAAEVPSARVVAVELDPQALAWAERNLARCALADRVELRAGSAAHADVEVLADLAGRVDVLVSNPPYIPDGMVPHDPEVREHDPHVALFGGGSDGLGVPRAVVAAAAGLLRGGGVLVMEHADVQGGSTRALAVPPVWAGARTQDDLAGRPRVLVAVRAVTDSLP